MIRLRVVASIGGLAVVACSAVMLSALSPETSVTPLILAAGQDRLADTRMLDPTTENLDAAAAASRAALGQAPYDTSAMLRLAAIDWKRDGRLDPEGVEAFAASYRLVAVDRAVAFWRIRFALENWDAVPLDVRRAVKNEVVALTSEPGHRWTLRRYLSGVSDPHGRVVANLWRYQVAEAAAARAG